MFLNIIYGGDYLHGAKSVIIDLVLLLGWVYTLYTFIILYILIFCIFYWVGDWVRIVIVFSLVVCFYRRNWFMGGVSIVINVIWLLDYIRGGWGRMYNDELAWYYWNEWLNTEYELNSGYL